MDLTLPSLSIKVFEFSLSLIIIIMYIYYALINALSDHVIQINLNMIFSLFFT